MICGTPIGGRSVKFNLINLNGKVVWSTDSQITGLTVGENPLYEIALEGEFSSRLANKLEVAHLDDVVRTTDVV